MFLMAAQYEKPDHLWTIFLPFPGPFIFIVFSHFYHIQLFIGHVQVL